MVGDFLYAVDLSDGDYLTTLEGSSVHIDFRNYGRNVYVNDAKIVDTDIEASNGVIHAINMVLLPPEPYYDTYGGSGHGNGY